MQGSDIHIVIDVPSQILYLLSGNDVLVQYDVSTGIAGLGEHENTNQTPRGRHIIRAKIGAGCQMNTVFVSRRPTGEIYTPALAAQYPERDWILTRILWLGGLEPGFNRYGEVDTMKRYIYIHGTPDENPMSIPLSHGCIRMHGHDLVDLFDRVSAGVPVYISEIPVNKDIL
jgi:lipoprotein-anchoring transpeptidase ErfK/SrfK